MTPKIKLGQRLTMFSRLFEGNITGDVVGIMGDAVTLELGRGAATITLDVYAAVCTRCGQQLGVHDAEFPFPAEDLVLRC